MNFLPGWNPGFVTDGVEALTAITQVLSAVAPASNTITLPSGIQAGDLIVIADRAIGPTSGTTISGFTVAADRTDSYRQIVHYKLADGSEGGATVTGMNSTYNIYRSKACYVFRGNKPATSLVASTAVIQSATGDPPSVSVLASGGTPPLVVIGAYGSSGAVNPRTFTVGGAGGQGRRDQPGYDVLPGLQDLQFLSGQCDHRHR